MTDNNGDNEGQYRGGFGNGNLRMILGLLITILLAFTGYGYYHSQETERIVEQRTNQRLDVIEARQADVRERLRALEYRIERHEQWDDTRFSRGNAPGEGGRSSR